MECGIHFDFNGAVAQPELKLETNLYKNGAFIADPFRAWAEGDDPSSVRYTHVPASVFLARRQAVLAMHPLGLLVEPGDRVEDVVGDLGRFASIAVKFAAFTDGRGYSSARLLSERYNYAGEIRAVGDVLADQIPLMARCGISAFVVTNAPTRKALEARTLAGVGMDEPVGTEAPLGTRPFLCWAMQTACLLIVTGRPGADREPSPNPRRRKFGNRLSPG